MKIQLVFIFVSLFGVAKLYAEEGITAKVIRVIDGNTIEIVSAGNEKQRVVFADIDCPELGQAFGAEAKLFVEKLILQKKVMVQFKGKDRFGNYLAVVMVGDDDLRVQLLKEGLAWTSEKKPAEDLEPYRSWAQQKSRGLWKQSNPTPPWTYRRQNSMSMPKSQ